MAILKKGRTEIILPDGSRITQSIVDKVQGAVNGGEHIVRQDVQNGYGIVIESHPGAANNFAVSVDRTQFHNKEEIAVIDAATRKYGEDYTVARITDYETDHVSVIYATKEEVENLALEGMNNYTLKTVTNQVWTTSVTTFATKAELDEIAKKYGLGIVIMGSVANAGVFDPETGNYEYSPSNPKRFQGETYFTSDLKHLWQFNLKKQIVAGPQVLIDKVNGFAVNETTKKVPFQIWIGKEHPTPEEELTIKFGFSKPGFAKITLPGEVDAIESITALAKNLSPYAPTKIQLELHSISDSVEKFEEFVTFTTYAGAEEVPQILALTSPIYFNGFIPAAKSVEERAITEQNKRSDYKISSNAVKGYNANVKAVFPGDELIGTMIEGTYGHWLNLGTIVGPPNELVEEVLVTTVPRQHVTVAGSQPVTTLIPSTASVTGEYPNQQLNLTIAEGVQGAPGVRGSIGNKITPAVTYEKDANNNRSVQMLAWEEYDWNNNPIAETLPDGGAYDPNNPNSEYPNLPTKVRIEGLDSFEVWKDYYGREQGVSADFLTKENYFLDITGDSAFKFWRDFVKSGMTVEEMVEQIPGFGDWFNQQDVVDYIAFQRGDAYIPEYNEETGVVSFKFFDKDTSPSTDPSHNPALAGWRVRGQVYEPSVNHDNGEISFTRKYEESTGEAIPGVNIRGNVWVPAVDTATGELSWTNTRDTNNPADVTPAYIYGPIYEPVITYSKVPSKPLEGPEGTPVTGFQPYEDEIETLTWKSVRKPTSLQTSTNIKGLKGSPVRVELNLVNDVATYDEFALEISDPKYHTTPDHVGYNVQTLSVFTPFDKHNLKIHDSNNTAWYVGVDTEGRLVTSNTPFGPNDAGRFADANKKKMDAMRRQIKELQETISAIKSGE